MKYGIVLSGLFCLALVVLTGCPKNVPEPSGPAAGVSVGNRNRDSGAFQDLDPWILKTTDPNANRGNHGIFLGNGKIGATFGPNGGAGKDSVTYTAGDYNENETLRKATNWHEVDLPDPKPGEPYEQMLDMKRGVLTTKVGKVTVTDLVNTDFVTVAALNIQGLPLTTDEMPSLSGIGQIMQRSEKDGSWTRSVDMDVRPKILPRKYEPQFSWLRQAHEEAWAKLWKGRDIVIEGDPEAQQLVHKLMFDLLQSTRDGGDDSIAPETLSGDFYKGHIFWDADVWMLPALLPQFPERAKNILDYRFRHRDAAKKQAATKGYKGIDFPWESAKSGNETAPGGFSEGRHVTAGVGWAHGLYFQATGDKKWLAERGWPILSGVADYFASRAKKNASGGFDIEGVTGPDEFEMKVKNNAYTNAMAANCLRAAADAAKALGRPANPQWAVVAKGLALPFDTAKGVFLKVEGDTGKKTKQADGELLLWPAQLAMDDKTAAATFDFHKSRVIANGPAMTASIHALIAARLGRADEAEKAFRESYRPFVRGPFLLFSEKKSLDRCVFATGAGGVLQSVLYGFGGLDLARPDGVIPGKPALPKGWKKLTVQGIRWKGKIYDLTVTPTERKLTLRR